MSALVGLCLAAAALELEAVSVGQWTISRPLILGPLLGVAAGDVRLGLWMGALMELLLVEDIPIGGAVPINGPVAAASAMLVALGEGGLPPALALPVGYGLGLLYRPLESALRDWRSQLSLLAEMRIDGGEDPRVGPLVARALAQQFLCTFLFLLATTLMARVAGNWGLPRFPAGLWTGLQLAYPMTPLLGLAALTFAVRPR